MLTEKRKNELINQFIFLEDGSDGALHCLEIQELAFLCAVAAKLKTNPLEEMDEIDCDKKIKNFYRIIIEKFKAGHEMFIAYNKVTHYPNIDNGGFGWIFSKKEYAEAAVNHYEQQKIKITLKQLRNEQIKEEFELLYRLGIKILYLDNGQYRLPVNRCDVFPDPDFSNYTKEEIPIMNPETNFAILQFLQILYSKDDFEENKKLLQMLEARMMYCIIHTKFLIPIKLTPDMDTQKQGEAWIIKEGSEVTFATVMDNNNRSVWLPVFTDWEEALKVYPKSEWEECVASYDMILELVKYMEGFLVNMKGMPLRVNRKNIERFEKFQSTEFYQKLEESWNNPASFNN